MERVPKGSDPIEQEIERRLLSAPALSEAQVRDYGQNPQRADLIRLDREDGGVQLPAFQFDKRGRPFWVVTKVNTILDAEDDPWGVADWWLGRNAWFDAVPAELIGHVANEILIEAAQAVGGE